MEGNDSNRKLIMLTNPIGVSSIFKEVPPLIPNLEKGGLSQNGQIKSDQNSTQNQELLRLSKALSTALKGERKKKIFCANAKCGLRTQSAFPAPSYAQLYLGTVLATGAKICNSCLKKAETFHEKSKDLLTTNGNLFSLRFEAIPRPTSPDKLVDLVSPHESDSETEETPEASSEEEVYVSLNGINRVLGKALEKVDIKAQLQHCEATVNIEVVDLAIQLSALDIQMDQLRSQIDSVTNTYNDNIALQSKPVVVGTVDIDPKGSVTVRETENLSQLMALNPLGEKSLSRAVKDFKTAENEPKEMSTGHRRLAQLVFTKPKEGQNVFAMHKHTLFYWLPARVLKVSPGTSATRPTIYTVEFQQTIQSRNRTSTESFSKDLTGKQVAFKKPSKVMLPVGTRVVAKFNDELNTDVEVDGMLYAGVVAEVPKNLNKFRYLIFFDDGYAQYVDPNDVFPVVESSPDVWLDIHRNSQEFVRDYVTKYPERHMIRTEVGASFTVELHGRWLPAKVAEVDGSLMKVKYLRKAYLEYEWIYRGSTRLGPLYSRLRSLEAKPTLTVARRHTYSSTKKNFSFEVNRNGDEEEDQSKAKLKEPSLAITEGGGGATGKIKNRTVILSQWEADGKMTKVEIPKECPSPRPLVPHVCKPTCAYRYEAENYRKVSPLAIPFHLGWAREISGAKRDKVFYHTPCGLKCGSYQEIHSYVTKTGVHIPLDFFSMEFSVDCLNQFQPSRVIAYMKDISYGKEWTPISCVNSLDHEFPAYMDYTAERLQGTGVNINDDDGFLTCCDCEDDCQDKEKCACWQQTLAGISFKLMEPKLAGYENRRLGSHILSGIYECNRKCKCRSATCSNRVVQNKVQWPLQLFKTTAKGWGVRAMHDIPKGTFISVYAGKLLNDAAANETGREAGDEYLAELDFIECNEQIKADYESDATDIENEDSGTKSNARVESRKQESKQTSLKSTGTTKLIGLPTDSSSNLPVARKSGSKSGSASSNKVLRNSSNRENENAEDDENIRVYSSFSVSAGAKNQSNAPRLPFREYFGETESDIYIMDAKSKGNIGRYFNHSCKPNLFVQNVFVDSHDPRFPLVAFFTNQDVKAGTELTWDYNYLIGSVPGKTLYCYCLQKGCRGRLL